MISWNNKPTMNTVVFVTTVNRRGKKLIYASLVQRCGVLILCGTPTLGQKI